MDLMGLAEFMGSADSIDSMTRWTRLLMKRVRGQVKWVLAMAMPP